MHYIYRQIVLFGLIGILFNLPGVIAYSQEQDEQQQAEDDYSEYGLGKKEEKPKRFIDNMVFGGDLGLSFGSSTYIYVSPIVGYRFAERLVTAVGFTYIYSKEQFTYLDTTPQPDIYRDYTLSESDYGIRGIATYTLFKNLSQYLPIGLGDIILHLEDEALNLQLYEQDPITGRISYTGERVWANSLMIGGGMSFPLSARSSFYFVVLFNVTPNKYVPYSNPIFKLGFYL